MTKLTQENQRCIIDLQGKLDKLKFDGKADIAMHSRSKNSAIFLKVTKVFSEH